MKIEKHLKDISEIRSMMEQSSKFISLSGTSGFLVGGVGLVAAWLVHRLLVKNATQIFRPEAVAPEPGVASALIFIAIGSMVAALALAVLSSVITAKRKGLTLWAASSKQFLIHLIVPLSTGGVFGFILLSHGLYFLIPATLLVFYGLSLLNASKFTLTEIRTLGYAEITVGLLALFWPVYSLILLATGFGLLHILNGIFMHYRYEM